jgi:site-specific DNA recombinase
MSPTHANKKGVLYRYYVSQALLQGMKSEAGAVLRVIARDVEDLVMAELRRRHLENETECEADRNLIERILDRVAIHRQNILIHLQQRPGAEDNNVETLGECASIAIPFAPAHSLQKGARFPLQARQRRRTTGF